MPKMLNQSQRDPRWANVKIGKTNLRVGDWGCALTGVSDLTSFYGCYISPEELARLPYLFDKHGRIIWSQIERATKGRLKFVWRAFGRDDKRIKESIKGAPATSVILEVNNGKHWVVGVDVLVKDYRVSDTLDGKQKDLFKAYPNITGSAHLIGTFA